MRTNGYSGTGLACSCCHWCPCENSRPCVEQVKNTTLCLFLWAVTADQSRNRWGVWFSANVNATAVWLANGFSLVAWTWPKKEASAIFAWLMFQPTSAQMHTYFAYLLASTFKNNHAKILQSTSIWYELYLVFLLVVFNLRKQFSFFPVSCQDMQNESLYVGQSLYPKDVHFYWGSIIVRVRGVTGFQSIRVLYCWGQCKDNWHFETVEKKYAIFWNFVGQMSCCL